MIAWVLCIHLYSAGLVIVVYLSVTLCDLMSKKEPLETFSLGVEKIQQNRNLSAEQICYAVCIGYTIKL